MKALDRIATRIALAIVLAVVLAQVITFLAFVVFRPADPPIYSARFVADRAAAAATEIFAAPRGRRAEIADDLADLQGLSVSWQAGRPALRERDEAWPFMTLRAMIMEAAPGVANVVVEGTRPARGPPGRRLRDRLERVERGERAPRDFPLLGIFTVAIEGPDQTWLVITPPTPWIERGLVIAGWLLAVGVLVALLSLWAARRLARPLAGLEHAARRLAIDRAARAPVEGPLEIRTIAGTFNDMSERLARFVDDRTQMLAAISHDLRTPLTRLRLRAESIPDAAERARALADLDDMDAMIRATLEFARDDARAEPAKPLDLATLLESLCDEASDAGATASYAGPAHLVLSGRPLALKRALGNLIDNAIQHGRGAEVSLGADGAITVTIADRGPGLPADELERVFEPFYRPDTSRSRDTGGVGLGLAIARSILRGAGGDVVLANRDGGGLVATVTLPRL